VSAFGELEPRYLSVDEAASRLSLSSIALRARCRRRARNINGAIRANLGAGIVAVKIGRSWRVLFPQSELPRAA